MFWINFQSIYTFTCQKTLLHTLLLLNLKIVESLHSANFIGNSFCGRQDRTFLICYMTSCDYEIKSYTTLCVGAPHPNWPMCQVWYNIFLLPRRITWQYDQTGIWLCKWEPITISHHPTWFGVYRSCSSRDAIFLISHLRSCDHVIKSHVTL